MSILHLTVLFLIKFFLSPCPVPTHSPTNPLKREYTPYDAAKLNWTRWNPPDAGGSAGGWVGTAARQQ